MVGHKTRCLVLNLSKNQKRNPPPCTRMGLWSFVQSCMIFISSQSGPLAPTTTPKALVQALQHQFFLKWSGRRGSMPRSGSASAALISNINMLADHKHHASGALWSTRWSTGAGQRSEVHELRLSHRAPQCMSWRRPPTRRSRHAAGSPSCVGYQEPWPSAPPQGPGCAGVVARGYCGFLISPIEVLAGAGTPLI